VGWIRQVARWGGLHEDQGRWTVGMVVVAKKCECGGDYGGTVTGQVGCLTVACGLALKRLVLCTSCCTRVSAMH
jgi:hypothetical protein